MSATEQTFITPDDLLAMPDGDRYELVDGQLVEGRMGSKANWVSGEVFAHLREYAKAHGGWAFPDGTGYVCYPDDPDRLRRPDASYIAPGRLDEVPDGWITIPPDLAVEVISPNDLFEKVEHKVIEYLEAGVRMVWVISPANRWVRVFERGKDEIRQLDRPDDELTGGDVLPGFNLTVGTLFPK